MTEPLALVAFELPTWVQSVSVHTEDGRCVAIVSRPTADERKAHPFRKWIVTREGGKLWPDGRATFGCARSNPEIAAAVILRKIAECLAVEARQEAEAAPAEPATVPAEPVRAFLVYQGGIANVFKVDCLNMAPYGRNARRLIQGDFKTCVAFARGMAAAGANVATAFCNMAGDITDATWSDDVEQSPFRDSPHHVIVSTNLCLGV